MEHDRLDRLVAFTYDPTNHVKDENNGKYDYAITGENRIRTSIPTDDEETPHYLALHAGKNMTDTIVACLGFDIHDTTSMIYQIQGKRGAFDELKRIDWDHALVDACETYTANNAGDTVGIVPAAHFNPGDPRLTRRLRKRYNGLAKKRGYTRDDAFYKDV